MNFVKINVYVIHLTTICSVERELNKIDNFYSIEKKKRINYSVFEEEEGFEKIEEGYQSDN